MSKRHYHTSKPKIVDSRDSSNDSRISCSSRSSTEGHYASSRSSMASGGYYEQPYHGDTGEQKFRTADDPRKYVSSTTTRSGKITAVYPQNRVIYDRDPPIIGARHYHDNKKKKKSFKSHSYDKSIPKDAISSSMTAVPVTFERLSEQNVGSMRAAEAETSAKVSKEAILQEKAIDAPKESEIYKSAMGDCLNGISGSDIFTPKQSRQAPKNPASFSCTECGKAFSLSATLWRHIRCHGMYSDGQSDPSAQYVAQTSELPPSSSPSRLPQSRDHSSSSNSHSSRSHSASSGEPSSNFETDSACSGEDTEAEEDCCAWPTAPGIFDLIFDNVQAEMVDGEGRLVNPALTSMKRSLVDRVMKDFWIIFNQEWSANIRTRAASRSPSSSASNTHGQPISTEVSFTQREKGQREDDEDGDSRKDQNPNPRKSKDSQPDIPIPLGNFACPYRKHDPRKYNHQTRRWRNCAFGSFDTVARVKAHLYRYHKCFQCERCGGLFSSDDLKTQHFMAVKTCDLKPFTPTDGITNSIEKQLRSRKKHHASETQEERWKDIYQILFPTEIVPSPYFEPIQDDGQSTGSMSLSNYEDFSRQELPRVFRNRLEAIVNEQAQPIEDGLRSQLISMIQESQNDVFATFRARVTNLSPLIREEGSISAHAGTRSDPMALDIVNSGMDEGQETMQMLQTFYQEPPYQSASQPIFGPTMNDVNYTAPEQQDQQQASVYTANSTAFSSSSFGASAQSTVATSLNSGPQIAQIAPSGAVDSNQAQSLTSMADDFSSMMDPASASAVDQNSMFLPLDMFDLSKPASYEEDPNFHWSNPYL